MSRIREASRQSGSSGREATKRFEVIVASKQVDKIIVVVAAENEEEAKEKALAWQWEDVLDSYTESQDEEVLEVARVDSADSA